MDNKQNTTMSLKFIAIIIFFIGAVLLFSISWKVFVGVYLLMFSNNMIDVADEMKKENDKS